MIDYGRVRYSLKVKFLGGLEESQKALNRLCILKWITPQILDLSEAIRVYKEIHYDRREYNLFSKEI